MEPPRRRLSIASGRPPLGSVPNKDSRLSWAVIQGFQFYGGLDEEAALLVE